MNQSEQIQELLHAGWMTYMIPNSERWEFLFRRNRDGDERFPHDFLTVLPSGRVKDGICETCRQRLARKRRGILHRDFRDWRWR